MRNSCVEKLLELDSHLGFLQFRFAVGLCTEGSIFLKIKAVRSALHEPKIMRPGKEEVGLFI